MAGFTADDIGTGGPRGGPPAPATVAAYVSDAERTYGVGSRAFLALYPVTADADVAAARKAAGRDRARVSMALWAAEQLRASRKVYTYYFDRVLPWPAHPEFGAFHTSEVPYVFRTIRLLDRPWQPVDATVSEAMASYWTNFARTCDPNDAGLAPWPAFAADRHETMQIGPRLGAMAVAAPANREFFAAHLRQ